MTPEEVLERASWLAKTQADRVKLQEELQGLFEITFNDEALRGKPDWVMELKDPQPFNAVQWLVDVLAHDEPSYKIEVPEGALPLAIPPMGGGMMGVGGMGVDPMQEMLMDAGEMGQGGDDINARADMADLLERTATEVFRENDLRLPTSLQRDELYAGFVSGMIVNKVGDLRLNGGKWNKYQQTKRGASPFFIKSINPAQVYFEYDEYGVCEVYHRYMRPLREVVRLYGAKAVELQNVKADNANGMVLFCEYWTEETRAAWIQQINFYGASENYVSTSSNYGENTSGFFVTSPTENALGFIPYSLKIARGTTLFNRQSPVYPHLYAGHKSKLFLRNNLFFTVAASLAFMLVNPQWVQETDTPENVAQLDFSRPAVHGVRRGDKITPLDMRITPEFQNVMTLFAQKIEESTVSKVVAGQSPGGVTAASAINQLIGGGKLTVSSVQKAIEEVRAGTVRKIFDYVRAFPQFAGDGEKTQLDMYVQDKFLTLDPASMPERLNIRVNYEPFLPQDKALAMQTWLTPFMQGLISSDFFYEQVGVQDVVTMRQQIDGDKDRQMADQQFQQQMMPQPMEGDPNQSGMTANGGTPEAVPGMEGAQNQDMVIGQPSLNPQPAAQNPANALNAMFNAIQNPNQPQ